MTAPRRSMPDARKLAALLIAGTGTLIACGSEAVPVMEEVTGAATASLCGDSTCAAGFDCIDGGCQGANHPENRPFTGTLPMNTACGFGSLHCNVCVDDVR